MNFQPVVFITDARSAHGGDMDKGTADELERRAKSMHLSVSKYCKVVLIEWIESGKKLKLREG